MECGDRGGAERERWFAVILNFYSSILILDRVQKYGQAVGCFYNWNIQSHTQKLVLRILTSFNCAMYTRSLSILVKKVMLKVIYLLAYSYGHKTVHRNTTKREHEVTAL